MRNIEVITIASVHVVAGPSPPSLPPPPQSPYPIFVGFFGHCCQGSTPSSKNDRFVWVTNACLLDCWGVLFLDLVCNPPTYNIIPHMPIVKPVVPTRTRMVYRANTKGCQGSQFGNMVERCGESGPVQLMSTGEGVFNTHP